MARRRPARIVVGWLASPVKRAASSRPAKKKTRAAAPMMAAAKRAATRAPRWARGGSDAPRHWPVNAPAATWKAEPGR